MNYSETLDYLFSQLPMFQRIGAAAYKANLDTTLKLDEIAGHPHRQFSTIHVAGTNGKGSVSHMLAMAFQHAGFNTGLYTSPHLVDFRERIKINGVPVPEIFIVEWVAHYKSHLEKLKPSFFEMTVAMAFDYFAQQRVDVAIIEVGMGGRLDSTNIITPKLSVITNIGKDHMQFLGNTLAEIAHEKAGIIKPTVPAVVGEYHPETIHVFENKAYEAGTQLVKAWEEFSLEQRTITKESTQHFELRDLANNRIYFAEIDLLGKYQRKNIVTVATALKYLSKTFPINLESALQSLKTTAKTTGLMGRWQIITRKPFVVTDIAHNPDGIREIAEAIKSHQYEQLHMIIGVVNDKDVNSMLRLLPKNALFYFTQPSIPRAMPVEILKAKALKIDIQGKTFSTVAEAYKHVMSIAKPNDFIYIGGSAFVVADILLYLNSLMQ